jgi:putative phosphoribosyl transferase
MMFDAFPSREHAGRELALRLKSMAIEDPVVLALPRGGVPIAAEVARVLHAPLDLLLVRKIGVPAMPELAAAAIVDGEKPELVLNQGVMETAGLSAADIHSLAQGQLAEIERRRRLYRPDRKPVSVQDKTAIVIDDGVATGTTAKAALQALRRRGPKAIILAVPVGSSDALADLGACADEVVCLQRPEGFYAIGQFYSDFHQLTDEEVIDALGSGRIHQA